MAVGDYSTALGAASYTSGLGSAAVGYHSVAFGSLSTALGYFSYTSGLGASALGAASRAVGDKSTGVGYSSAASGLGSVVVGALGLADGNYTTAVGYGSSATAAGSTAIGTNSSAIGTNSVAIGNGSDAHDYDSVAIGVASQAAVGRSTALGARATASGVGSSAFGNNARATADNSMALGASAIADRSGTVSVGAAGSERQIVNVAVGAQATDAVNVAQVTPFAGAIGGGASFAGGVFVAPSFTIQDAAYSDVGSAFGAVDAKLTDLDSRILASGGVQGPPGPAGPTGPEGPAGPAGGGPDQVSYSDSSHATILLSDEHGTVIGDVADGVVASDAVNKGQLDAQTQEALDSAQTYTDAGDRTALAQANAYTDQRISAIAGIDLTSLSQRVDVLDGRVDALDAQVGVLSNRIGRVAALGAAMSMAAPDAGIGSRSQIGVGVGSFRGHSAVGFDFSRRMGRSASLRIGAAFAGHGDNSVGAGVHFGW